jgi:hypothetical protein
VSPERRVLETHWEIENKRNEKILDNRRVKIKEENKECIVLLKKDEMDTPTLTSKGEKGKGNGNGRVRGTPLSLI